MWWGRSSFERRGPEKLRGSFQFERSGLLKNDSSHQVEWWSGEPGAMLRIKEVAKKKKKKRELAIIFRFGVDC